MPKDARPFLGSGMGPWPAAHLAPPETIVAMLLDLPEGGELRMMQVDLAAAFSDRASDWPNALLDVLPGADRGAWGVAIDASGWGVTVTRLPPAPRRLLERRIYRPLRRDGQR